MDPEPQSNPSMNAEPQPEVYDRRTARRQRLEERRMRRTSRYGGSWIWGSLLILLGFFILLQNLTSFYLENWWALFIMIPAVGAFGNAWRVYQSDGRLSAPARFSLLGGLVLTMLAAMFLLNLSWVVLGPILLILVGFGVLMNTMLPG
jgi:hypothetical protein